MSLALLSDPHAHATLLRQATYLLRWNPARVYPAGTLVELRGATLRAFHSWRLVACDMDHAATVARWKTQATTTERWHNRDRWWFRARLEHDASPGTPLGIRLTVIPPIWAGLAFRLSLWVAPPTPASEAPVFQPEPDAALALRVAAGPVERFALYAQPTPDAAGRVRVCLAPQDRFGNPARFAHPVTLALTWGATSWDLPVEETQLLDLPTRTAGTMLPAFSDPKKAGDVAPDLPANPTGAPPLTDRLPSIGTSVLRLRASIPMAVLAPEENIANGQRAGDRLVVTSNPIWPNGPADQRAAFGEMHWHTDYSGDGQGALDGALAYARDQLNLDFAAPGDHNPSGVRWRDTVRALDACNAPDRFATFFGWENGTARGHENYYFTDPAHPLVCGGTAGVTDAPPDTLIDTLSACRDFFAVPHHTNAVAETRRLEDDRPVWDAYPWGQPVDYVRLVEIMQTRGNQERDAYPDAWRGWHQGHHASAQDALARGYRLGFSGGTDNHCGLPGRAFSEQEGAGRHPPHSVILTGVWTPRIERQAVFDALRARRTWAVWDTRALVWFTVNGVPMGDVLTVRSGTDLSADIRLSAEDALQTIAIVSDGRIVWQTSSAEPDVNVSAPLGRAAGPTYFYLRALQRDGGLIYASPVFVVLPESV